MRAQGGNGSFQTVRRVGVIDINGRATFGYNRPLEAAAHWLQASHVRENVIHFAAAGHYDTCSHQHICRLIRADER